MLVGVEYDEASRQLTVRGASGNLRVVVERLHVTAELHPDEVAVYVRRRRGNLAGWESDVPLWGERLRERRGRGDLTTAPRHDGL